jgi:serine protease AprX
MNRTRILALFILLTGLAVAGGLLATAHSGKRYLTESPPAAFNKISPWVLARTAQDEEVEFLVVLKEQADLGGAAALTSKLEKGEFVRAALWETAQTTQAPLLGWLQERKLAYRSFYIINALWVKGTRAVAAEIAARPEVARIEGNPQLSGISPIERQVQPDQNLRLQAEPTAEPGVSAIRSTELWELGYTGQGIVIGGQDTGVEWTHPALKARYRGAFSPAGDVSELVINHDYNWHDSVHTGGGACGPDALAPCDDHSHGTHTVGTVLGTDGQTNQIGVAPGAQFIACRNMDRGNGTPATYLECFEFMLAPYPVNGTPAQGDPGKAPDLTVNSWACPPSEGCAPDTLRMAVEAQRAAGIMTVVSAGNGGPGCSTVNEPPAHYAAVYSVGAFDARTGNIAGFSSRGPVLVDGSLRGKPDIAAPGVLVRSAIRGGGYASFNGTSMAGPHVVGAIALLWSAVPELKNQIDLTESLLNETAVPVEVTDCGGGQPNNLFGFGRLDVRAAYDLARASVTPLTDTISFHGGQGQVQVKADPGVKWRAVSHVDWLTLKNNEGLSGNGAVVYQVAENLSEAPRTGTLLVAGRTITLTQSGTAPFGISGRVVAQDGLGVSRVTMILTRADGTDAGLDAVLTDDEGRWSQTGLVPGVTYRVRASKSRQTFEPNFRDFSAPVTNLDFILVRRRIILSLQ